MSIFDRNNPTNRDRVAMLREGEQISIINLNLRLRSSGDLGHERPLPEPPARELVVAHTSPGAY